MTLDERAKLRALEAFAKAVDAATVFDLGSRPGSGYGERVGCIQADRMDEPEKVRRIQKARDRLVDFGVLEVVL